MAAWYGFGHLAVWSWLAATRRAAQPLIKIAESDNRAMCVGSLTHMAESFSGVLSGVGADPVPSTAPPPCFDPTRLVAPCHGAMTVRTLAAALHLGTSIGKHVPKGFPRSELCPTSLETRSRGSPFVINNSELFHDRRFGFVSRAERGS
jgi:hypothetical protein